MSSATSISKDFRVKAGEGGEHTSSKEQGFRPWHFFVLASLAASTAAVVLSRQSAPEHLILISLTIGAVGAAAAALYRTIAPLAMRDASALSARPSERARAALEREKALVLRSIKELEFDRAMGKVSARDFDEMAGRLRSRAMALMRQLDEGGSGYREMIERELRARVNASDVARPGAAGGVADLGQDERAYGADESAPASSTHGSAKPVCASCTTINDVDAAFCKRCGTSLVTVH